MLFDFKVEQEVGFWMQNTYVPLDMIFIRRDGRILRIAENTCTPVLLTISTVLGSADVAVPAPAHPSRTAANAARAARDIICCW
ncbi:MAG: DUF192 domain-containing protein, partial [Xanthobacteraceae bacterium]